jgi:hypothetical protein
MSNSPLYSTARVRKLLKTRGTILPPQDMKVKTHMKEWIKSRDDYYKSMVIQDKGNRSKWKHTLEKNNAGKLFNKEKFNTTWIQKIGANIGTPSAYGSVFKVWVLVDGRLLPEHVVIKMMIFANPYVSSNGTIKTGKPDPSQESIFMNEVRTGSHQELYKTKTGPRVLAYYKDSRFGMYVMDSFTFGQPNYKHSTLNQYLRNSCPAPNSQLIKMLKTTLLRFYGITKGYHGDLHNGNIAVVTDENNTLKWVLIFDYGAHILFKNKSECKHLHDVFKKIHKEHGQNVLEENNRERKTKGAKYKPYVYNGSRVVQKGTQQPYRSNVNVLNRSRLIAPLMYSK